MIAGDRSKGYIDTLDQFVPFCGQGFRFLGLVVDEGEFLKRLPVHVEPFRPIVHGVQTFGLLRMDVLKAPSLYALVGAERVALSGVLEVMHRLNVEQ